MKEKEAISTKMIDFVLLINAFQYLGDVLCVVNVIDTMESFNAGLNNCI